MSLQTPQPLDYAPPPRWHRTRRIRWYFKSAIVLTLAGLGWHWRSDIARHAALMYWQRECRDYVAPPDQIVFYQGSQQHVMRLMASDSAYRFDPRGFWDEFAAVRTVPPWNHLREMVDGPTGGGSVRGQGIHPVSRSTRLINKLQSWDFEVVVFLHERISPSGNKRLVVVRHSVIRGKGDWSVITASARRMAFLGTLEPESAQDELTFINTVNNADGSSFSVESICFYAGQVAPTDTSRFTIAYEMDGKEGTIDGQLLDDDHVRLMVRDTAATQPSIPKYQFR